MHRTLNKIKSHQHYNKALYWFKAISITGLAQVIVQAVGFACGILIIRLLPTKEYALYTLANTMLGTMAVLADGGISTGVMSQGGKVWQDNEKLGVVLATGLDLRRKFAFVSLIVSTPILFYLLLHNGASLLMAVLIVLSLIPAFYAALSDSLLEIVPKLHQSILPLQKNQVIVGIGRLFISALTLFVFPWTFVAILAGGFPRMFGNIKLRKMTYGFVDKKQKPDSNTRKEILKLVKRILPGSIYFSVSGQITIWLISIFGKATSVAQMGALGRIAMLLSVINVIIATLIIPRFARLIENKKTLFIRFIQIISGLVFLLSIIITFTYLFPNQILWILGKQYIELSHELILTIIGSCLSLIAGVIFGLYTCKGWMINPLIYIPLNISSIIFSLIIFNISTLTGILYLNILVATIQIVVNSIYITIKINTLY